MTFSFDSNATLLDDKVPVDKLSDVLVGLSPTVLRGSYGYDIVRATFDSGGAGVSAGSHTISVWGTNLGSTYHGNVLVTAVPEPESYALLLAGLGVVGFVIGRRRNNA